MIELAYLVRKKAVARLSDSRSRDPKGKRSLACYLVTSSVLILFSG